MRELPTNDIIIDVNKGYALRPIGTSSPNVAEQIVHTLVPLSNFCAASPKTNVCLYTSLSTKTNVLELATTTTSRHMVHTSSTYASDRVLKLISEDISCVLAQHHPDQVLRILNLLFILLIINFIIRRLTTKH
jgi:hypothetical protein